MNTNAAVLDSIKFFSQVILLYRMSSAGSFSSTTGLWIPGVVLPSPIYATIINMTDEEMQQMPEGSRSEGMLKVYSETQMRVADIAAGFEADFIVWKSTKYKAVKVYPRELGDYYLGIFARNQES